MLRATGLRLRIGLRFALVLGLTLALAYGLLVHWRIEPLAAMGVLALWAAAATAIGTFVLTQQVTRPINALADAATRIEAGDYSVNLTLKRKDEIGRLATSFDLMRASIEERESEVLRLAYQDGLTGLPNRAMFNDRLTQAMRLAKRTRAPFTVMMMDLDRFKQINDSLGHQAGDQVLAEVALRMRTLLRESDTLARFGGDEFAMLLPTGKLEDSAALAQRIAATFETPVSLGEQPLDVSVTIGAAYYPEHGEDTGALVQRADMAMYAAKRKKAGFAAYDPQLDVPHQAQLSLLGELRRAVEQNELRVYYQAKLDMASATIAGAETLVRWIHPKHGYMPPTEFIPFAEQTGFIRSITAWMLTHALAQSAAWSQQHRPPRLSINISARDLLSAELPTQLEQLLARYAIDPKLVCLEITESALMEDPAQALENVARLRATGALLSIDDYGTGYSSLAYIRDLNVHELKIDQTFVRGLATDARNIAIVRSAIELAHNLGIKVTAEGVEEERELELLREWGCDEAQGYLISSPVPAEKFEALLSAPAQPRLN
jgi:diguanylate cyclase (GGDEF)-like protein